MEEPSNLFDLPNIDQLRWYIANAFCNYKDMIKMNDTLEENIVILEEDVKRYRSMCVKRAHRITKLEKENKMLQEKLKKASEIVGTEDPIEQINYLNSKVEDLTLDVMRYRDMSVKLLSEKRALQNYIKKHYD